MRKLLSLAVLTAASIPTAIAGHLVLTLNNPVQTGVPGDSLVYTGHVTYVSDDIDNDPLLYLAGDSFTSPSENLSASGTLLTSADYLLPGWQSVDFNVSVFIDPSFGRGMNDVFGMNPFDYTLYGGVASDDYNTLIDGFTDGSQVFFANIVDPNAPPTDPSGDPTPVDPPLIDPNAPAPADPGAEAPEPGTILLFLTGFAGTLVVRRRTPRTRFDRSGTLPE
jgi:hypothetical protein